MVDSADTTEIQKIDIKKVFREKSPSLARLIPGFVYNYMRRILHEDENNAFLERHGRKDGLGFIKGIFSDFNVKVKVIGEENLPAGGRYFFVSNHPLGGFDGIMLIRLLKNHYDKVVFLVNDILMNLHNLREFWVPINKHGAQSRESIRILDEAYRSDWQIISFPSGMVSRKNRGVIRDLPWQKNFIVKARQYQRDVVPIHVSGRNTNFFYNLANLRKFFRIGWNLEMFYLVDEAYKHRNKTFTLHVGKPVSHKRLDSSASPAKWASAFRELVYQLPENPDPVLSPR